MSLPRQWELRWGGLSKRAERGTAMAPLCVISCKDRDLTPCCLRFNWKKECAAVFVYLYMFYNIEQYIIIYICTLLIVTYLYIAFHRDSGLPFTRIFPKQRRAPFDFGWGQSVREIHMITNIFFWPLGKGLSSVSLVGISTVMPKRRSWLFVYPLSCRKETKLLSKTFCRHPKKKKVGGDFQ